MLNNLLVITAEKERRLVEQVTSVSSIGVGAQSTLGGGGAPNFCPKNMYLKISKMPEFYKILARKIIKIPEFL